MRKQAHTIIKEQQRKKLRKGKEASIMRKENILL